MRALSPFQSGSGRVCLKPWNGSERGMINPKDEVKKILEDALEVAEDSLKGVRRVFSRRPYGPKVSELVDRHQAEIEKLEACIKWVNSHD